MGLTSQRPMACRLDPEIKENGLFIKVIFYKSKNAEPDYISGQKKVVRKSESLSDERSAKVIKLMTINPRITKKELSVELGINESAVQKYIVKLKTAGIIERTGPDRGGRWLIIK